MKVLSIVGAVFGAVLRVVFAIAVVYLIYQGAGICYDYGYRIYTEPAVSTAEGAKQVKVAIRSEMSPWDIGELFERVGLVNDGRLFTLQYYLSEFYKDVGPGEFELSTAMTAEEMMEYMAENCEKEDDTDEESE